MRLITVQRSQQCHQHRQYVYIDWSVPERRLEVCFFFFSSRRRHTRFDCDWSSDVCSSDLISLSFLVLFMVIIGGLGSILGSFLGAGFIVLVPIFLTNAPHLIGIGMPVALQKQIELMVFGALIIFFLIVEPAGLARLWQITKEKLRLWPFPH